MSKTANKQKICDVLMEQAALDRNILVLCSDSRGSGSMTAFANAFPSQFVETGIAEQNLVSIAAGLAKCGKKPFAVSPASFLSARSYEQAKVDVAYSNVGVRLIGISGGISYGSLGMSHHSLQDIAAFSAIPNMRVYLPSDAEQTGALILALLKDEKPAYIRVGRNPVETIYPESDPDFRMDKAQVLAEGEDVLIVACGEMTAPALKAVYLLKQAGIHASLLDMYCVKPYDESTFLKYAAPVRAIVTVEEHAPYGGLGAVTAQIASRTVVKPVINLSLPDAPVISGTSQEVFDYYGLNAEGIEKAVREVLSA